MGVVPFSPPAMRDGELRASPLHGAVDTADHGLERGHYDVFVDADAEDVAAVGQAEFHVGNGTGIGTMAHGVFAVINDVEGEARFLAQGIAEAIDGAIADALDGFDGAIDGEFCGDRLGAVVA